MRILEDVFLEKIGGGGVGIGKTAQGKKIVVKGSVLPESVVDIIVTRKKDHYIEGTMKTLKSFPDHFFHGSVVCPHYIYSSFDGHHPEESKSGCGGCRWQALKYDYQLNIKKNLISDSLRILGEKSKKIDVGNVEPSPELFGYRNKIEFSFGTYKQHPFLDANGDTQSAFYPAQLGFHQQGQFIQVIDIDQCFLISQNAHLVFDYLKKKILASQLPVYNQKTHVGFFRHLIIREGVNTKQMMVNLSVADEKLLHHQRHLRDQLQQDFLQDTFLREHLTTLLINSHNGLADIVHGTGTSQKILRGEGFIHERLHFDQKNVVFRISPFSFFQTNTHGAEKLFSFAVQLLRGQKGTLLDLYCGTGGIGITLLKLGVAEKVVGIEIVEDAVIDAQRNAKINGFQDQTFFVSGKVEQLIGSHPLVTESLYDLETVVVDPPRDGLHKNVINFLGKLRQRKSFKLLIISCNPVSFARDLDLLFQEGFTCNYIQPVDMFPQTHHVELMSLLTG